MKRIGFSITFILLYFSALAQFTISGSITTLKNEPLPGASVQIKNNFKGTASDKNGNFYLTNLPSGKYNISVSFIGYKTTDTVIVISGNTQINFLLLENMIMSDEITIKATKAGNNTPIAFNNLSSENFPSQNPGKDIPFLLEQLPSAVAISDAGTGIGYTYLRIRGTDPSRINVTLNGVPFNDPESQSSYWVDIPDIASSTDNIQVQRGVGTSSNGPAAFGATINLQTSTLKTKAYAHISNFAGSFNTLKNTIMVGSGLLNNHFTFDARVSHIYSNGFIDRAFAKMKSYYISGAYYNKNQLLRINIFQGDETTFQSWNGVPKARLTNNLTDMQRYQDHWLYSSDETQHMLNSDNRTYNYYTYKNEIDKYEQTNAQLLYSLKLSSNLNMNITTFFTKGNGYFEQFKQSESYSDYLVPDLILNTDTLNTSDLVRRKWLDNSFYGLNYSFLYTYNNIDITLGGSANQYNGNHFGKIIWMQYAATIAPDYEWYRSKSVKNDINSYFKVSYNSNNKLNIFTDLQYRYIDYKLKGTDDAITSDGNIYRFNQNLIYNFINPKAGISYKPISPLLIYCSFGIANREPARSNIIDAPNFVTPKHETLYDYESGVKIVFNKIYIDINAYYMHYKNQLVYTGQVNNVGNAIMINVPKSFRTGIELQAGIKLFSIVNWNTNISVSKNKIKSYTAYFDNWDTGTQETEKYSNVDLSLSPSMIASNTFAIKPLSQIEIIINTKFVGKQYIDNTQNITRMLDNYLINNLELNYTIKFKNINSAIISFQVNNILNHSYESNAWVYRYFYQGEFYNMDGYFPQAGRNFLAGIVVKF